MIDKRYHRHEYIRDRWNIIANYEVGGGGVQIQEPEMYISQSKGMSAFLIFIECYHRFAEDELLSMHKRYLPLKNFLVADAVIE